MIKCESDGISEEVSVYARCEETFKKNEVSIMLGYTI